jgi:hypothetical protein
MKIRSFPAVSTGLTGALYLTAAAIKHGAAEGTVIGTIVTSLTTPTLSIVAGDNTFKIVGSQLQAGSVATNWTTATTDGQGRKVKAVTLRAASPDGTALELTFSIVIQWVPTLLTNLISLLDASDAGKITASGGLVSSFRDHVGVDFVQATGAAQPGWNGLALSFDGSNDYLQPATFPTAWPRTTVESWVWCVADNNLAAATTPGRTAFGYGTTSTRRSVSRTILTDGGGVQRNRFQGLATSTAGLNDTVTILDGPFIAGTRYVAGGASLAARLNGADTTPATAAQAFNTSATSTVARIGANCGTAAGAFWSGNWYAGVITGALTGTEVNLLEGWLAWQTGQQAKLAAGHPYKSYRP